MDNIRDERNKVGAARTSAKADYDAAQIKADNAVAAFDDAVAAANDSPGNAHLVAVRDRAETAKEAREAEAAALNEARGIADARYTQTFNQTRPRFNNATKVLEIVNSNYRSAEQTFREARQDVVNTSNLLGSAQTAFDNHKSKITMKSNMKINIDEKILDNLKNFFDVDIPITPQKTKGGQKTQKNRIISKNRGGSRKNMNSIDSDDSDDSDDSVDPNDSHL